MANRSAAHCGGDLHRDQMTARPCDLVADHGRRHRLLERRVFRNNALIERFEYERDGSLKNHLDFAPGKKPVKT